MTKKNIKSAANRRGDPDVVAKRRHARALNALFSATHQKTKPLDGRKMRALEKALKDLNDPKKKLRPIEKLKKADLLLEHYPLPKLKKQVKMPTKAPVNLLDKKVVAVIKQTQRAYAFKPVSWYILLGKPLPGELAA